MVYEPSLVKQMHCLVPIDCRFLLDWAGRLVTAESTGAAWIMAGSVAASVTR